MKLALDGSGVEIGCWQDSGLIPALIVRWRPKTNTFYFTPGEVIVTLEDVVYSTALPVVGRPLIGQLDDMTHKKRLSWYLRIHTNDIPKHAIEGGGMKFIWFDERFAVCPTGVDQATTWMYTKAYILYYIRKVMFPSRMKNRVQTAYLQFMNSPYECTLYSWGALSWHIYTMPCISRQGKKIANLWTVQYCCMLV